MIVGLIFYQKNKHMKYLIIAFLLIFFSCSDSKEDITPDENPDYELLNFGHFEWTSPDGVLYDIVRMNIISNDEKHGQIKVVFPDPYGGASDYETPEFVCNPNDITFYQVEFIRPEGKMIDLSQEDVEIIFVKHVKVG